MLGFKPRIDIIFFWEIPRKVWLSVKEGLSDKMVACTLEFRLHHKILRVQCKINISVLVILSYD